MNSKTIYCFDSGLAIREGHRGGYGHFGQVCKQLGEGGILLNCIDKEGMNPGFDLELINVVRSAVTIPVIVSSGAGE